MKKIFTLFSASAFALAMNAQAPLVDQAQLITHPGGGSGGANVSATQTTTLGATLFGVGQQNASNNWIAERITVPASGWSLDSLITYGYQTGSTTTSTFTGIYCFVSADSSNFPSMIPVLGSKTTNAMTYTTWTGIYRSSGDDATGLANTQRPIMKMRSTLTGVLNPGNYWVVWSATGSLTSGPWNPPVTVLGNLSTGMAHQFLGSSSVWDTIVDGSATLGMPFKLYGTIPTSVKEVVQVTAVNVMPNPVVGTSVITIELGKDANISMNDIAVKVYDQLGKEVRSYTNVSSSLEFEKGELNAGSYMYRVVNKNNNRALKSGNIVIQ